MIAKKEPGEVFCQEHTDVVCIDTEIGLQLLFLKRGGIRENFGASVTEEKKNDLSSISVHPATESVFTLVFCIFVCCFVSQVEGPTNQH